MGPLVAFRHEAGPTGCHLTGLNEFGELKNVAAQPADEAVPALLVEHDVKRPVRLTLVPGAIALEKGGRLILNLGAEQFTGDRTDIRIDYQPVASLHIVYRPIRHVGPGFSKGSFHAVVKMRTSTLGILPKREIFACLSAGLRCIFD